ncbi:MAG: hypothetical protein RSF40_04870 [Oscillospiraceae bacterium]
MNYENLVVASSDVQLFISVGSTTLQLATGTSLQYTLAQNVQDLFAIGQIDPIANKSLNATFAAQLSLQSGEYETILDALNATVSSVGEFYASMLNMPPFTISWCYQMNGLVIPKTVSYALQSCRAENVGGAVDRNDPETISSWSIKGTGIVRRVTPL